jgi:hypothetical protein
MTKEQASLHEPFEENTPQKEKESRGVFRSRVDNFFDLLDQHITEETKREASDQEKTPPSLPVITPHLALQESEVITNAEKICKSLEELRMRFISEFDDFVAPFISKGIDSMIEHIKDLRGKLHESYQEKSERQLLLKQVGDSLEFYALLSRDEKKLKRKIVLVAHSVIKEAIDKDLEMLASYKKQAFEQIRLARQKKKEAEVQLDRILYPLLAELSGLSKSHVETDDLLAFFDWKNSVDLKRNSLVEQALLLIDAVRGDHPEELPLPESE